jgi:hypothetical protein
MTMNKPQGNTGVCRGAVAAQHPRLAANEICFRGELKHEARLQLASIQSAWQNVNADLSCCQRGEQLTGLKHSCFARRFEGRDIQEVT